MNQYFIEYNKKYNNIAINYLEYFLISNRYRRCDNRAFILPGNIVSKFVKKFHFKKKKNVTLLLSAFHDFKVFKNAICSCRLVHYCADLESIAILSVRDIPHFTTFEYIFIFSRHTFFQVWKRPPDCKFSKTLLYAR